MCSIPFDASGTRIAVVLDSTAGSTTHTLPLQNTSPAIFVDADGNPLITDADTGLLLDAGTHPRLEGRAALPLYDLIGKEKLDAIAISHCHHDHVGSLPVALRHFPEAHVLMTELSYFIAERVLHNSVNIMTRQRDELGIREYPLYSHDEVDDLAPQFQGFKYNREVEWAAFHKTRAGFHSPTLEFLDAGHALGSAGIMVRSRKYASVLVRGRKRETTSRKWSGPPGYPRSRTM